MLDLEAAKARFKEEDFEMNGRKARLSIEPSGIQGSPYDHLFIYLTEMEHEGRHLIVSDQRELDDQDGILVGMYRHYEAPGEIEEVQTLDEAVQVVRRLING